LKESGAKPGQWVALPGAGGGLGHLAVQYAAAMGLRVVGIDTGKEKENLVKSLGAEAFIDFETSSDVIEDVKNVTNGGPHAVIVIAASAKPYEDAMRMCRTKGTVVAVGLPSNTVIRADVFDTVVRNLTVKGSYVYVTFLTSLNLGGIGLILPRQLTSWLEER
jgi:alcohol dehydrogenase, propanol-preferring